MKKGTLKFTAIIIAIAGAATGFLGWLSSGYANWDTKDWGNKFKPSQQVEQQKDTKKPNKPDKKEDTPKEELKVWDKQAELENSFVKIMNDDSIKNYMDCFDNFGIPTDKTIILPVNFTVKKGDEVIVNKQQINFKLYECLNEEKKSRINTVFFDGTDFIKALTNNKINIMQTGWVKINGADSKQIDLVNNIFNYNDKFMAAQVSHDMVGFMVADSIKDFGEPEVDASATLNFGDIVIEVPEKEELKVWDKQAELENNFVKNMHDDSIKTYNDILSQEGMQVTGKTMILPLQFVFKNNNETTEKQINLKLYNISSEDKSEYCNAVFFDGNDFEDKLVGKEFNFNDVKINNQIVCSDIFFKYDNKIVYLQFGNDSAVFMVFDNEEQLRKFDKSLEEFKIFDLDKIEINLSKAQVEEVEK